MSGCPPTLYYCITVYEKMIYLDNIKRDMLREYCTDGGSSNLFSFLDGWFTASISPVIKWWILTNFYSKDLQRIRIFNDMEKKFELPSCCSES